MATSGAKWQGITLEKHISDSDYIRTDFVVQSNLLHIFSGVPVTQEWRFNAHTYRVLNTPGSVMLAPKGLQASVRTTRSKPDVQWILEVEPPPQLELLNGKKFELTPQLNVRNPQLVRLVQLLQAEVETGSPTGILFGETVSNSLILYLAQHYSIAVPGRDHVRGGLPGLRLKQVLEYIEANLSRDVHLDELAETASLSSFHFAKLFKQSTGASPHQYILQRRLERAKELLRKPGLTLSEISQDAGFSDQSHFTNVFRRFVGVPPSKYRSLL
jgi:AraC family transcriptional regulator